MNKRKILIIGANERMRRKAATLINRLQGAIAVERESCTDVSACFANRRIDAVLLENDAQVEEVTLRIRNAKPGLPILAYADDPSYENTRSAFLAGVRDVLCLRATTSEEIGETLEKVLDPARRTNADETLLISQAMEVATLRGRYLEEQLLRVHPAAGRRGRLRLSGRVSGRGLCGSGLRRHRADHQKDRLRLGQQAASPGGHRPHRRADRSVPVRQRREQPEQHRQRQLQPREHPAGPVRLLRHRLGVGQGLQEHADDSVHHRHPVRLRRGSGADLHRQCHRLRRAADHQPVRL